MPKTNLVNDELELRPRISVIGVGGAGGNAVNNMIRAKLEGVEFLIANTDAQALTQSLVPKERRIQLGLHVTQGLGAGSKPDVGRASAEESIEEVLEIIKGRRNRKRGRSCYRTRCQRNGRINSWCRNPTI
jgi:cell division protein FtsZ